MLKECAATAITNMAVLKSHGIVLMINFMLQVCAKIVILITTIVKSGKKNNVKKFHKSLTIELKGCYVEIFCTKKGKEEIRKHNYKFYQDYTQIYYKRKMNMKV